MDNPRPDKVAVVDEVRARLDGADASVVTEYRGLTVKEIAQLRRSLTAAGGEYKVFKNTLVKRAIDGSAYAPLDELLTGPTAIAFVHGDVSAVAKALRDFARTNTHLVVKGGLLDGSVLTPAQLGSLADLPSRDALLAMFAGAVQAPLTQLAGLMQALTRNLAYGLKALIDERGGPVEPVVADSAAPEAVPSADVPAEAPEGSAETPADADVPAESPEGSAEPASEAPGSDADVSAEAPGEQTGAVDDAGAEEAPTADAAASSPEQTDAAGGEGTGRRRESPVTDT